MATPQSPNQAALSSIRRFRTNPVELAVFSVVTLIFCNSVYNLAYDQTGPRTAALTPMAANPLSEQGALRTPASVTQALMNLNLQCDSNPDQGTQAMKVRMTGSLCKAGTREASAQLTKTFVINHANKFNATVFTDANSGRFSTDYIPLSMGKNPIHVEFTYSGGKIVTQDVNVVKN